MKISIDGCNLDTISMKFCEYSNRSWQFPEHRHQLVETKPLLVISTPAKLAVQLFVNEMLSRNENKPSKIKLGRKKERAYVFIDAKFPYEVIRGKEEVHLFFREIDNK